MCRVKTRKVPESVVEAVVLAVELVDGTVETLPGAVYTVDPRDDEMTGQLTRTRAEVVLLTSRVYDLEEVCDKAKLEHETLLKSCVLRRGRPRSVLVLSVTVLCIVIMACCGQFEGSSRRLVCVMPVMPVR